MNFATLIRLQRYKAGLTQTQLAIRVGVASSTVSRWETGRDVPSRRLNRVVPKLCEALGVPEDILWVSIAERLWTEEPLSLRIKTSSYSRRWGWAQDYHELRADGHPYINKRLAERWSVNEQTVADRLSKLRQQGMIKEPGQAGPPVQSYCREGHVKTVSPKGFRYCQECLNEKARGRATDSTRPACAECDRPAVKRGWCERHYLQWRRAKVRARSG